MSELVFLLEEASAEEMLKGPSVPMAHWDEIAHRDKMIPAMVCRSASAKLPANFGTPKLG
jgi:hypothetical protein